MKISEETFATYTKNRGRVLNVQKGDTPSQGAELER